MRIIITISRFILPVLFVLAWLSCSTGGSKSVAGNESFQQTEVCKADESHRYEIYMPSGAEDCKQIPLLLIIDPHGKAKYALEKFIPVAEKYKVALASSYLIQNNFSGFPSAINLLLEDLRNKFGINQELYIAGFSGGARMAITYAQYYPVKGVFMAGALATPEQLETAGSLVYALSGMADFNFIEAAQYLYRPEQAPENLRIEFTESSHEWPTASQLENALGYIFITTFVETVECVDINHITGSYLNNQINILDKLVEKKEYIAAYQLSQNLAYSDKFHNDPKLLELFDELNYDKALNNQLSELRESIRFELENREAYYETLFTETPAWWEKEVKSLNEKIENNTDRFSRNAYKRIKAFLGITLYSLVNNAVQSKNAAAANQLLPIYEILEPNNPDMLYFNAVFAQQNGNSAQAARFLDQAIEAGFNDTQRIRQLEQAN